VKYRFPKANSPFKIYNTLKDSEKADRRQRKNLVMAESSQLFEEKIDEIDHSLERF